MNEIKIDMSNTNEKESLENKIIEEISKELECYNSNLLKEIFGLKKEISKTLSKLNIREIRTSIMSDTLIFDIAKIVKKGIRR